MKILVFDSEIGGHHLEYINHIYNGCRHYPDNEYIFVTPDTNLSNTDLEWNEINNIKYRYLSSDEINTIHHSCVIHRCLNESKLIKRICQEQNCSQIILINMAPVIPVLPLLLPNDIKIKGIIYNLFTWKRQTGFRKLIDKFRYWILSKNQSIEKIFILNDEVSTDILNKKYNSEKFMTIVDPLPNINMHKSTLAISDETETLKRNFPDEIIFLHFGAMDWRKGTIDILNALELIPKNARFRFVFAGKVNNAIRDVFYSKVDSLKDKFDINVIDCFCSYDQLQRLCELSDCILIPYHITAQSSGLLGHASRNHVPVIGPQSGLIGHLINTFKLGLALDKISGESLANAISNFTPYSVSDDYAKRNTIEMFQTIILQ